MKVGKYMVPDIRLPDSIQDVKKIYDRIRNTTDTVHFRDIAVYLDYSGKSMGGAFYRRLNSLTLYGLLDGRGKMRVTELGESLAYPAGDKVRKQSYTEAFLNIYVWNGLFKIHKKNLPDAIWIDIKNITGVSPIEAQEVEGDIRRWYMEDVMLVDENIDDDSKQKSFSPPLPEVNVDEPKPSIIQEKNSGKLLLNVEGKNFDMDFGNKDTFEVALGALKLFGRKVGWNISYVEIPNTGTKQGDNDPSKSGTK
jgi:hypothetical protein